MINDQGTTQAGRRRPRAVKPAEALAVSEPPKSLRQRRPSNFRQQDVARAIKAAKGSGLDIVRVEVDPKSAKIVLVVKNDDDTETKVNPFDDAPVDDPALRRRKTNASCKSNSK